MDGRLTNSARSARLTNTPGGSTFCKDAQLMTEYTQPEERTYAQMMEIAKKIHPDARVRMIEFVEQKWEIYIPSEFVPVYRLPECYKDTPAWAASLEHDGSYGDELSRWGYKNGYRDLPIEGIADYFNLMSDFAYRKNTLAEDLDRQVGLIPMSEITDWEPISRKLASLYMGHRKIAENVLAESYSAGAKVLKEKWDR
jgi:hypothetical protein